MPDRKALVLADGQPIRPFLIEARHLAFAIDLPIFSLIWTGASEPLSLRILQSAGAFDLPREVEAHPCLRAGAGRAVLVAECVASPAARESRIMFLSGDSRPKDAHFGPLVRAALTPFFTQTFDTEGAQSGIPPDQALPRSFAERQAWLQEVIETSANPGHLILMGRSSGARIASTLADQRKVRGLVCLGYPFRQPGRPDEPERSLHLPRLQTPTLIIQGNRDRYGGADVLERYPLAPNTKLVMLDTDHGFRMEQPVWDRVGREILLFLGHCCATPA